MVVHRTEKVEVTRGAFGRHACRETCGPTRVPVPIIAAGEFDGAIRDAIVSLKYARNRRAARLLGDLVAPLVPGEVDVVTWIPTAPSRVRRRGFDHAELIARAAAKSVGCRCRRLLRRCDDSRQTGRNRSARSSGPSLVASGSCRGKFVALVDDVATTGATARVAAAEVLGAGATAVVCLCVASVGAAR